MADIDRERRGQGRAGGPGTELRLAALFDEEALAGAAGECAPPMDVLETAEAIEVVMDLPAVPAADIRLAFAQGTLVVAGRKRAGPCPHHDAAFHLVERGFGRFLRAVRLTGAIDAGRASATLVRGELRVVLPRIEERRGRDVRIPVVHA